MRYHRFDFPDLPIDAFKHYGDRRIKPQGGGGGGFFNDPLGETLKAGSDLLQKGSDVVHDVTAPIIDPVFKAVADVGQGVSDVIHDVGTTVAKSPILSTAAYAVMVANGVPPTVASALVSANAGASPETIARNMVLAGVGSEIASKVAPEISKLSENQLFGQAVGQAAGSAASAAVTGRDPLAAALTSFVSSGANVATGEIVKDIPGFDNLPKTAQDSVRSAVNAALQGKDPTMAAVNRAMNAGVQEAVKYGTNIFNGSVTNIDQADFGTNQGAVDKVAAEQAQNDFYDSIGINPDTVKDTAPASNDVVDQLVNAGMQEAPPTVEDIANIGGQPVTTSPGEEPLADLSKSGVMMPDGSYKTWAELDELAGVPPGTIYTDGGTTITEKELQDILNGTYTNPKQVPKPGTPKPTTPAPKPTTAPTTAPTTPTTSAATQQGSLQNLLGLMALSQPQQAPQTPMPVEGADIKLMEDIFGTNFITPRPEGVKKYSSGGEIEALLHLLRS